MSTEERADLLQVRHPLAWVYERSTGPIFGRYLAGLRAGVLFGGRGPWGEVVVPPPEAFPNGQAVTELVAVGPGGVVTGWTWQAVPRPGLPLNVPFAWALVLLDGATGPMVHAVAAPSIDAMATGVRVTARWRDERRGEPGDLVCFDLVRPDGAGAPGVAQPGSEGGADG